MKRFIITMLCVSVFFIGLGGIFESVSAKFKSDEKALELIKLSRIAIGGDTNLRAVNSMTIVGNTTNYFEKAGVQDMKQGSIEINMQFPGQFSKMVKIGNPENAADGGEIHKEVDVVVVGGNGDVNFTSDGAGDGENVFIIKKGDGKDMVWTSEDGDNAKADGGKIIIKKDDGTVEEIKTDGKHKVIVRKDASGNVLTEDIVGPKTVIVKDADGKVLTENEVGPRKIIVEKETNSGGSSMRQNEMLRTTLGLLMTAPEGLDVSYKFLGTGNVDGFATNNIEVSSQGSTFKLFLDASSNLPRAVSYTGGHKVHFVSKDKMENMPKDKAIEMKKDMAKAPQMEHLIKFSDFRSVGGLLLPYRWVETVNGKQSQITDITSYELNPANIADKFSNQKVFVRKMKPKSDN